jgi:competence protein ComEC
LVILIVAPEFLFDVGFQLSYAAVVSILLFEPHFRNLVRVKSIVLKYIRDIVTVSLAAQIGTLPLSLFYFHQFPGLFLATNLVVIPMLSIIMALGIIVMALAVFGITLSWVNWPLEESLQLMNTAIAKIASCDAFVARNIPADSAMLLLGFSVVLASWLCIRKPDFRSMARAGAAVIVLQTYVLYFGWKESLPEAVLVFQQSRMSVVAVRDGRRLVAYGNGEMPPNGPASAYATAHGLLVQNRPMPRLLFADGRKILLWSAGNLPNRGLRADILLLCQSPKINFERLVMQLHPKLVIADGSNYGIAKRNWRRTCQKQKIPFHDTDEKGCFVLSGAIRTSSPR